MMQEYHHRSELTIAFVALLVVSYLITIVVTRSANKLAWHEAAGVSLLFVLVTALFAAGQHKAFSRHVIRETNFHEVARFLLTPVLPTIGSFLLMIVQEWRRRNLSTVEQPAGGAELRRWLMPARLVWACLIALSLFFWAEVPPLVSCGLMLLLLGAYPFLRWADTPDQAATTPAVDGIAPEREKVLNMVAEKQITPEEGAELLSALAVSNSRGTAPPLLITSGQRLVMVGATLVAVAFFLPWFSINLGEELSRLTRNMSVDFRGSQLPAEVQARFNQLGVAGGLVPQMAVETPILSVPGGKVPEKRGWLILVLAVVVAAVPFVGARLDRNTRWIVQFTALALGVFLLLYSTSEFGLRNVAFGLLFVAIGYVCEIAGLLRDWRGSQARAAVTAV